jgi:hypothetical protein
MLLSFENELEKSSLKNRLQQLRESVRDLLDRAIVDVLGIGEAALDGFPGFVAGILSHPDPALEFLCLVGKVLNDGIELAARFLHGVGRLVAQILQGRFPGLALSLGANNNDVAHGFRLIAGSG